MIIQAQLSLVCFLRYMFSANQYSESGVHACHWDYRHTSCLLRAVFYSCFDKLYVNCKRTVLWKQKIRVAVAYNMLNKEGKKYDEIRWSMRVRSHCGVGSGARLKAPNDINIGGGINLPLPLSSTLRYIRLTSLKWRWTLKYMYNKSPTRFYFGGFGTSVALTVRKPNSRVL